MNRSERILDAQETLDIIKNGHYYNRHNEKIDIEILTQKAIQNAILYDLDSFKNLFEERDAILKKHARISTHFETSAETTLQATQRLKAIDDKIFCLNFASAKNPGGGFLGGAQAQEESLARSSALHPCISQMTGMYERNRRLKTCLYSDEMIYSPDVPVFKNDYGQLLDNFYTASFLTSPAVNVGALVESEKSQIDRVMLQRLDKILAIAVVKGYKTLILGAWGCGVFRNDPVKVAQYFKYHLTENPNYTGFFERVVFAIYSPNNDSKNLEPFKIF